MYMIHFIFKFMFETLMKLVGFICILLMSSKQLVNLEVHNALHRLTKESDYLFQGR